MTFPRQAAEALDEIALLQRRSRRSLGRPWFPLVCFGLVTVISAPLVAAFGTVALVPLWLLAGALVMLVLQAHYRRRAGTSGVAGRSGPVLALSSVMFALCFAAGLAGGHLWGRSGGMAGPIVVVLLGYALLGRLHRDGLPALVVLPAAAVGVGLAVTRQPPWLVVLVFGVLLVAAGGLLRLLEANR